MNIIFESKPSQRIDTYASAPQQDSNIKQLSQFGEQRKSTMLQNHYSQSINIFSDNQIANNIMMMDTSFVDNPINHIICKRLKKENILKINEFAEKFIYSKSINFNLKMPQNENLKPQIRNIVDYTGAKFVGLLNQNHLKHGNGILIQYDGNVYIGEFQLNQKHGQGIQIQSSQERYEGQFFQGKRSGKGTIYYTNGDSYEGQFENGLKNGYGKYISYDSGETYFGMFCNDKKDGKGMVMNLNGDILYEGFYKEDQQIIQNSSHYYPSKQSVSCFQSSELPPSFLKEQVILSKSMNPFKQKAKLNFQNNTFEKLPSSNQFQISEQEDFPKLLNNSGLQMITNINKNTSNENLGFDNNQCVLQTVEINQNSSSEKIYCCCNLLPSFPFCKF